MNMLSKNWIGYCIKCCDQIHQNNNMPFCSDCYKSYNNINNSSCKTGIFCHVCKCSGQYSEVYPICKQCLGLDREGHDSDSDLFNKLFNKFSSPNFNSKLIPLWASDNRQYLWNLQPANSTNYIADLQKLVFTTNMKVEFDIENIFNNTPKTVSRILNILERWDSKLYVDPPIIINNKNHYSFQNGKHRTIAALYLKAKTIPVFLVK